MTTLKIQKAFSLIEVLFAIFIVSISLAGILSMSATFKNSKDKYKADAMAEMITHSIYSAMRLNSEEWNSQLKTIKLSSFKTINNQNHLKCINTNEDISCSNDELFNEQKHYLKTELFDHFACGSTTEKPFCLNLEKSVIEVLTSACLSGSQTKKINIQLIIERVNHSENSTPFSQNTIVCL